MGILDNPVSRYLILGIMYTQIDKLFIQAEIPVLFLNTEQFQFSKKLSTIFYFCLKYYPNFKFKNKKQKQRFNSSEEENDSYSLNDSSVCGFNYDKPNVQEEIALKNSCLDLKYLSIVKFSIKKNIFFYVGQVEQKVEIFQCEINFL